MLFVAFGLLTLSEELDAFDLCDVFEPYLDKAMRFIKVSGGGHSASMG